MLTALGIINLLFTSTLTVFIVMRRKLSTENRPVSEAFLLCLLYYFPITILDLVVTRFLAHVLKDLLNYELDMWSFKYIFLSFLVSVGMGLLINWWKENVRIEIFPKSK